MRGSLVLLLFGAALAVLLAPSPEVGAEGAAVEATDAAFGPSGTDVLAPIEREAEASGDPVTLPAPGLPAPHDHVAPAPATAPEASRILTDRTGFSFKATGPAHLDAALQDVGVVEKPTNSNRGPDVERYLAACGLGGGYAYCAAATTYWVRTTGGGVYDARGESTLGAMAVPQCRGEGFHSVREILGGVYKPPPGSLVCWQKGRTSSGHVGMVRYWDVRCAQTVEANTSRGSSGSQRDGGGVWRRNRCTEPMGSLRMLGTVEVTPRRL